MKSRYKLFLDPLFWAGILGVLLALYFIYEGAKPKKNDDSNVRKVGFIEKLTETVKVKPIGQLHWNLAITKQTLSAGDYIFTGENSSGVINLEDHGKLILGPHSMVIIQPGFIQVEAGEVELKATRNSVIKSFGSMIKVSANSTTKILNTETESRLELSEQDKLDQSNIDVVSKILNHDSSSSASSLSLQGLEAPWDIDEGKRSIKILTNVKFDRIKLVFKNPYRRDKEFTITSDELTLDQLPSGNYQTEAYAYLNGKMVTKSEIKEFEVINTKDDSPRIDSLVKEIEVFF